MIHYIGSPLVAVIVALFAPSEPSDPSTFQQVEAHVGTYLANSTATCDLECSTACMGSAHKTEAGTGYSYGGHHDCIITVMACEYHRPCTPLSDVATAALDELEGLVPQLPLHELRAIAASYEGLDWSEELRSLQVTGCNGLVVASIPV